MDTSDNTPPKSNTKKDLLLLFAAPAVVILGAIALVYAPRLLANPSYDFIYRSCKEYRCPSFNVSGEKLIINSIERSPLAYDEATLYYHDVSENTSQQISLADARKYRLLSAPTSPDNYKLTESNGRDGFFVWSSGRSDSSWYLADGLKKKRLNLHHNDSYYNSVTFIGWVQQ